MNRHPFCTGEYYHLYNRGVEKRKIFIDDRDYQRFVLSMRLMNDNKEGLMAIWRDNQKSDSPKNLEAFLKCHLGKEKLVDIVSFCLNPNHYHLILRQKSERGIETFARRLGTGYTMYFNKKYKRSGVLFQGCVKSSHIRGNEKLLLLTCYVDQNSFIHGYTKRINIWKYSSSHDSILKGMDDLRERGIIMSQFKNISEYKDFINENSIYLREKKMDKKECLE